MKLIHVKSKYADELLEMSLRDSGLDSSEYKRVELARDDDEIVATNALAMAMFENAKLLEDFYGEKVITKFCWALFESAAHNRSNEAFEACRRQVANIPDGRTMHVFKDYCWSITSDWKRLHCMHAFVVSPVFSEDRDTVINNSIGVHAYKALFE